MGVIEVGRICVKTHGRETGKKCVVVEHVDKNFVLVTGPKELTGIRRRRTNVAHLMATKRKVSIKAGTEDEAILKELGSAKLKAFMKEE